MTSFSSHELNVPSSTCPSCSCPASVECHTHFYLQNAFGLSICSCSTLPLDSGLYQLASQDSGSPGVACTFTLTMATDSTSVACVFFLLGLWLFPPALSLRESCILLFLVGRMTSRLQCAEEGLLWCGPSMVFPGLYLLMFQPRGLLKVMMFEQVTPSIL